MAQIGERMGEERYSESDELEEGELKEEEIISIRVSWATLHLGAELVMSQCMEEEYIKGKDDLLADKEEELVGA